MWRPVTEEQHRLDGHVGHLLGLAQGLSDVVAGLLGVEDLALPDASRLGLPEAEHIEFPGIRDLAHGDADLGGPDFQSYDDVS